MEKITEALNKKFNYAYNYLKLYEVTYDQSSLECVVTFLYPQSMEDVYTADRIKIQEFLEEYIKINGKIVVKFKKSFLDDRLIKKECIEFISGNFKAIAVYLTEDQISVETKEDEISIKFYLAGEIKQYFEKASVARCR